MASNQTEKILAVVQQYLQALGGRNLDDILAVMADEIDWYVPGDTSLAPWLGKRSVKADVKEFYELLWPATLPMSAAVEHIIADGEFAVVSGEFSTKMLATGKIVDSVFSIHITVTDGLITRYRLLEDSLAVAEALR